MTVNTAAGSTVFIGTTMPASSPAEFEMDYFTEVGEVEDLGEFGDEANEVTFTSLANRRVRKFKGSFDAGNLEVVCGSDPADPGQADMIAAMASDLDFNFRVILNDQITLGGSGTRLYFRGKVMSKRRNVGDVENIVRQTYTVGINTEIYEVAAT
jgi:hypothetical protein